MLNVYEGDRERPTPDESRPDTLHGLELRLLVKNVFERFPLQRYTSANTVLHYNGTGSIE